MEETREQEIARLKAEIEERLKRLAELDQQAEYKIIYRKLRIAKSKNPSR